ncbi:MAG: helix-turn-helix transcriptional regulator [Bacteroidota bacterium]
MYKKLKEARLNRKFSQKEFSIKVAMDQTTYSRKERGISTITNEEWDRFAFILDIEKKDIMEKTQNLFSNQNRNFQKNNEESQYISISKEDLDIVLNFNKKLEEYNLVQNQEITHLKQEINSIKKVVNTK